MVELLFFFKKGTLIRFFTAMGYQSFVSWLTPQSLRNSSFSLVKSFLLMTYVATDFNRGGKTKYCFSFLSVLTTISVVQFLRKRAPQFLNCSISGAVATRLRFTMFEIQTNRFSQKMADRERQ